jgi:hypothetical protein
MISTAASALGYIQEQQTKDMKNLRQDRHIVSTAAESLKFNSRNADQLAYVATISHVVAQQINSVNKVRAELAKNKETQQNIDTYA